MLNGFHAKARSLLTLVLMNGLCCCIAPSSALVSKGSWEENTAYLLIPNRKLPLCFLVLLCKVLQLLQRLILQNRRGKLDIALCILVAGEDLGIIRQRRERLVERRVHFLRVTLEKLAAARVEKRIASEDDPLVSVLQEPADTVLRVTWRVQAFDGDVTQLEAGAIRRSLCHALGVFAANDGEVWTVELLSLRNVSDGRYDSSEGRNTNKLLVAASVVPVVVGIYDSCEVDFATADSLLQDRRHPVTHINIMFAPPLIWKTWHSLRWIGRVDDDSIFGLLIRNQVGVVIATAHPYLHC